MSDGAIVGSTSGASGDDTLVATEDGSKLVGGSGDDTLVSGLGDDILNGGSGEDTAKYENVVVEYLNSEGTLNLDQIKNTVIFDTGSAGDGTDTLKSIEKIVFDTALQDIDGNDYDYTYYLDGRNNQVLAFDDTAIANEDSGSSSIDVLSNDVDLDGDALTITHIDGKAVSIGGTITLGSGATVMLNDDGTLNYQANGQYEHLTAADTTTEIISYTVTDSNGSSDVGSINVTIQGADDISRGNGIDGYLVGSTVFADTDGDGIQDVSEASSQTDGTGGFALVNASGNLVLEGGVDISTSIAFEGRLWAPEGSSAITALSTLVIGVRSPFNYGPVPPSGPIIIQGIDEALIEVRAAFGIDANADILNIDPVAATLAGDSDGATIMTVASQVLNTVTQIAALLKGAGATADTPDIFDAVFQQVAIDLRAADFTGIYDLTSVNSVLVESLIQDTADALDVTISSGVIQGAAEVIAAANSQTQMALDSGATGEALLTDIAQVSIVTQGEISNALESAAATDTLDAINQVVDTYTGANLELSIDGAESSVGDVGGLTPSGEASGGFVVTWTSYDGQDGSGSGVFAQLYDSLGVKVNTEFKVNTVSNLTQFHSSVDSLGNGGFVVTWWSSDSTNSGVNGQIYDANGLAVGSEFHINGVRYGATVTTLSDGGFVVVGDSYSYGTPAAGQRYDENGNEVGSLFQIGSAGAGAAKILELSDGSLVTTWMSDPLGSNAYNIYGQTLDSNSNPLTPEFQINSYSPGQQLAHSAASLTDGGFVVTWASHSQDGGNNNIYGQRYYSNGGRVGGEFLISPSDELNGNHYAATVVGLDSGGFVVIWKSAYNGSGDGDGSGVFGQLYDVNGQKIDLDFQVNQYIANDQITSLSSVDALSNGGFVVTWSSYGQDGSDYGVYARRYGSDGSELGDEFLINEFTDGRQSDTSVTGLSGLNYNPVAATDSVGVSEDESSVSFTFAELIANDVDPNEADTLSITGFDDSNLPTGVTLSADFTAETVTVNFGDTYQSLAVSEQANISLSYTISDGNGGTDIGAVNVSVNGINDAPVAGKDWFITNADTVLTGNVFEHNFYGGFESITAPDIDIDGDAFTVYSVNGLTENVSQEITDVHGRKFTLNADGSFVYDSAGVDDSLSAGWGLTAAAPFYQIIDEHGAISAATQFVINVQGVNDAPIAGSDTGSAGEDDGSISFTFAQLLSNDSDIDTQDTLLITTFDNTNLPAGVSLAANFGAQTVTITYGDTYQYLSDGETANLSFGYTLTDDKGASATGQVTLAIDGSTDAVVSSVAVDDIFVGGWNSGDYSTLHLNTGDGDLSGKVGDWSILANSAYGADVGDMDGDGDIDIVTMNEDWQKESHVLLNNGDGTFTDSQVIDINGGINGQDVVLGDFDNDGDLDAYYAFFRDGDHLYINDGFGNLSDSGQVYHSDDLYWNYSYAVAAADVNGDGWLDVVSARAGGNVQPNQVWLNDQNGGFIKGSIFGADKAYDVKLADLDGDGDQDAVTAGWYGYGNTVWTNDGAGNFTATGNLGIDGYNVILGDLDGDGDTDAFVVGSDANVWLNNGDATFNESQVMASPSGTLMGAVTLGDFDYDGDLDAYVGIDTNNDMVYFNDGLGNFTGVEQLNTDGTIVRFAVSADFDGSTNDIPEVQDTVTDILIFDNPYYTWDTVGNTGWSNEADSLQDQLVLMGYESVTRTTSAQTRDVAITPDQLTTELEGKDVFLMTAREDWTHLEDYNFGGVLESFVAEGGTLVAFGGRRGGMDLDFLNNTFGFTLTGGQVTDNIGISASVVGTEFSDDAVTLEKHDFSTFIRNDSLLDEDAVSMYDGDYLTLSDYASAVTVLNYGAGEVVWMGWSYDKIGYTGASGSQDPDNWNTVLADAVDMGIYDFFSPSAVNNIDGTSGSDILVGLDGSSDIFVFEQGDTGTDTIQNFNTAEGDQLDLSDLLIDIVGLTEDGTSLDSILDFGVVNTGDTQIDVDVDGDNITDQTIILTNVDLVTGSTGDVQIINDLFSNNNLEIF